MSDFWMLFIASILCICIAYGLGVQVGYKRGCRDTALDHAIKSAEEKARKKYENSRI